MKTIFTLIAIIFTTATALSQNAKQHSKVDTIEIGIVHVATANQPVFRNVSSKIVSNPVVRLYKFKNSRVLKALSFTTKNNVSKIV